MLKLLKSLFDKEKPLPDQWGTGALPAFIKGDQIKFNEIVSNANDVIWEEKTPDKWRRFPERNQYISNSCMAQAGAKEHGVLSFLRDGEYIDFSATPIYKSRSNKPAPGMAIDDLFDIKSKGVTLEKLVKSQGLSDKQMDSVEIEEHEKKVGEIFATSDKSILIPDGDFDTCASVIKTTGKAVVSMFYFTKQEWSKLKPTVDDKFLNLFDGRVLRHGVALVDAFTFFGEQVIRAEDSAHFGGFSERLLTREFFSKRNFGNRYSMRFKFDDSKVGNKPVYDGSIISLQKCLRFEGCFPVGIDLVENFGPLTKESLIKFQIKYKITPALGTLGPKTIAKLKELFS